MKEGKYTKTLAKIWVEGIFRIRDIRGNVLPKFIEFWMDTSCWSSSGWSPTWRTETNRNNCYRVLLQSLNLLLEEPINIKVIIFQYLNCLGSKFLEKSHFFNLNDTSLVRHVNAASSKSLEIQAYSIIKPRALLKRKFVWKLVSAALIHHESKISVGSIVL